MGDSCTDLRKFIGIAEEIHHFLQFFLLLVRSCHISKGNLFPIRHPQHRAGFSEVVQGVGAVGPAHEHGPDKQQDQANHKQRQDQGIGGKPFLRNNVIILQHTGFHLLRQQITHLLEKTLAVRQRGCDGCLPIVWSVQFQGDDVVLHHKAFYLLLTEQFHHLRVGNLVHICPEHFSKPGKGGDQNHHIENQWYESTIFQ